MKKLKRHPKFKTEDEERQFWATHSSMDYIDWSKAKSAVLPKLKRTERVIAVRISDVTYEQLSALAARKNQPLPNIAKQIVRERAKELVAAPRRNK